ncbi:hypothetical protein D6T64_20840 [Cryobacterium melibiosiphilum]|uniref:Uncharacterized protein n=1 Tax=Cryobacterium melibiosiphilum TaxID=995039 RepID=A0A3A5M9V8_9MICO|nr:hypothetical protein [Cryobacterium melibiosiphilum]RJT84613.1 hypothetical protein D6T64_20840 [Cryobacterium melibiosiphilum]
MSRLTQSTLITAVGAVLLTFLVSGCSPTATDPAGGGTASAAPSSSASASPTGAASPNPETTAGAAAPEGDCPAGSTLATTYTVITDDSTTPVVIEYTAFNQDGSAPVQTETVYGPIVSRVSYSCDADSSGELWTLTATSTTQGALSCLLGFGGKTVSQDTGYNEGALVPLTVDCTGNPGR